MAIDEEYDWVFLMHDDVFFLSIGNSENKSVFESNIIPTIEPTAKIAVSEPLSRISHFPICKISGTTFGALFCIM